MKYFALIAPLAAVITATSLDDLPNCAVNCVTNGLKGVDCAVDDFQCSCPKSKDFIPLIANCFDDEDPCSAGDKMTVVDVMNTICNGIGIPITADPDESLAALVTSRAEDVSSLPGYGQPSSVPKPESTSAPQSSSNAPVASSSALISSSEPCTGKPTTHSTSTSTPIPAPSSSYAPPPPPPSVSSSLPHVTETCVGTTTHTITVTHSVSKPLPSCPGAPDCPPVSSYPLPSLSTTLPTPSSSAPSSAPTPPASSSAPTPPAPSSSAPTSSGSPTKPSCPGYSVCPPPSSSAPGPGSSTIIVSTLSQTGSISKPPFPSTTGSATPTKPSCTGTDKCPPVTATSTVTGIVPPPFTGAAVARKGNGKVQAGVAVLGLAAWLL